MTTPLVSVIIPHHLDENRHYLEKCVNSVLASKTPFPYEVIVVADSKNMPLFNESVTVYHDVSGALCNATRKAHFAVTKAHPESKYFLFISDDVVLGQSCMARMAEGMGDNHGICNPMSNSDNGSQYLTDMPMPVNIDPDWVSDERLAVMMQLMELKLAGLPKLILQPRCGWVAFYCTMIPRKSWALIGPIDERLDVRHNDQDYCYRAAAKNIPTLINLGAFALHFGSKTLGKTTNDAEKNEATRVFMEKWKLYGH